jgi:hypothetical protein
VSQENRTSFFQSHFVQSIGGTMKALITRILAVALLVFFAMTPDSNDCPIQTRGRLEWGIQNQNSLVFKS